MPPISRELLCTRGGSKLSVIVYSVHNLDIDGGNHILLFKISRSKSARNFKLTPRPLPIDVDSSKAYFGLQEGLAETLFGWVERL